MLRVSLRASRMSIAECQDDSSSSFAVMSLIRSVWLVIKGFRILHAAPRELSCMRRQLAAVTYQQQSFHAQVSSVGSPPLRIPKKSAAPADMRFVLDGAPVGFVVAFSATKRPDQDNVLSALGLLPKLGGTNLKGPITQRTRSTGVPDPYTTQGLALLPGGRGLGRT